MPRYITLVEIDDALCVRETDKAIKVFVNGAEFWVPKSLIDESSSVKEIDDEGTLVLPEWFALQEGLADEVD